MVACSHQPATREGQAGPYGVADRPVVPVKPGNSGGGKGPDFGRAWEGARALGLAIAYQLGSSSARHPRNKLGPMVKSHAVFRRVPCADVRRRAGCGRPARPVRREGGSALPTPIPRGEHRIMKSDARDIDKRTGKGPSNQDTARRSSAHGRRVLGKVGKVRRQGDFA